MLGLQETLVNCPVCRELFESSIMLTHNMQIHKEEIEDKNLPKSEKMHPCFVETIGYNMGTLLAVNHQERRGGAQWASSTS